MTDISKREKATRDAARAALREFIKPGDRVQCILRHVSRTGMMRHISLRHGDRDITRLAAQAAGGKLTPDGRAIKIAGCGMDMGFSLVSDLGYYLWPKGTPEPHGARNGQPDTSGEYALKHEWI